MTGHNLNLRGNNLTLFTRSLPLPDTNISTISIGAKTIQNMTCLLYRIMYDPLYNAINGARFTLETLSYTVKLSLNLSILSLNLALDIINYLSWYIGMLAMFCAALALIVATGCSCYHYKQITDWLIETYQIYCEQMKDCFIETNQERLTNLSSKLVEDVPAEYCCLITKNIMTEPVYDQMFPQHKFEKKAILTYLKTNKINPYTTTPLLPKNLVSDVSLKQDITQYVTDIVNQKCRLQIL